MAKFLKLGPNASSGSFYCPILKFSLGPGQVAEFPGQSNSSKIFKDAYGSGHITDASQEEYDAYQASLKKGDTGVKAKKQKAVETTESEDEKDPSNDEVDTETLTKTELIAALKDAELPDGVGKLNKMTEDELRELYLKYVKK